MKFVFSFLVSLLLFLNLAFAIPTAHPHYSADYEKTLKVVSKYGGPLILPEVQFLRDAFERDTVARNAREIYKDYPVEILMILGSGNYPGYNFPNPRVVEQSLNALVEKYQDPNLNVTQDEREMILGDAYHWLGHIYEEKLNYIDAFDAYVRSYAHYQKTKNIRSPTINQRLVIQEHADWHLQDIIRKIPILNAELRKRDQEKDSARNRVSTREKTELSVCAQLF